MIVRVPREFVFVRLLQREGEVWPCNEVCQPITRDEFEYLREVVTQFAAQYERTGDDEIERLRAKWFQDFFEERERRAASERKAATPKMRGRKHGYVYLAWCETGDHKIGRSKRPKERVKVFDTAMPLTVEVVHTFECDDYVAAEAMLHERFADVRIEGGEWFELDEAQVEWIKGITHYEDGRLRHGQVKGEHDG